MLTDTRLALEENERNRKALELWRRWFAKSGDPWWCWLEMTNFCFFCDEQEPNHHSDCVYVEAKRLIEE